MKGMYYLLIKTDGIKRILMSLIKEGFIWNVNVKQDLIEVAKYKFCIWLITFCCGIFWDCI